jgi:hypothetical protein
MSSTMGTTSCIVDPDVFERRLLLAVEILDPVVCARVTRGIAVSADGLATPPFLNHSGLFIWLAGAGNRPKQIVVSPTSAHYLRQVVAVPAPAQLAPSDALVRAILRPAAAYPFADGVTALWGVLRQGPEPNAPALPDIRVQLAWFDEASNAWVPSPPKQASLAGSMISPAEVETDARGEFGAFLRLQPRGAQQPDIDHGMLRVRLQFTRSAPNLETRITAPGCVFVPGKTPGRVGEGRVVPGYHDFHWSALQAV